MQFQSYRPRRDVRSLSLDVRGLRLHVNLWGDPDSATPERPVDLAGHSMGGNVVVAYAGVRPERVRRLINLEGFGLPDAAVPEAAARLARWLDQLAEPVRFRPFADLHAVSQHLRALAPKLDAPRAAWLAEQWSTPAPEGGRRPRADPAHKRVNPIGYRAAEAVASWRCITAPVLLVQGRDSRPPPSWADAYPRAELEQRLSVVRSLKKVWIDDAGHMLHHEQPGAVAAAIESFLG